MKNLRTEEEILATWHSLEPLVSICCTTFNQDGYIRNAVESFLNQETKFPFEIILHDDASTDLTKKIILDYKDEYPNIIKVILQDENQYSLNGHLPLLNTLHEAKGEYIALCEGDDYWISSDKLQKQIDTMNQYSGVKISFHASMVNSPQDESKQKIICNYGTEIKVFSAGEVIKRGGGFMPTASIVFTRDKLAILTEFIEYCPVGDIVIQNILALEGVGALYIPDLYSYYSTNVSGSWSSKKVDIKQQLLHHKLMDLYYQKICRLYPSYWFPIYIKRKINVFFLFKSIILALVRKLFN